jgi:uncharacterized protein
VKIGVISDTHNLLRPGIFDLFREVDCIIHAGDVGSADILSGLRTIAPVYAVHGNCDRYPLTEELRASEMLFLADLQIFLTHIGGRPQEMRRFYPEIAGCDLVIFGHSHRSSHLVEEGVVFFNPGAAGPRRFRLPVTVGTIEVTDRRITPQIIEIE